MKFLKYFNRKYWVQREIKKLQDVYEGLEQYSLAYPDNDKVQWYCTEAMKVFSTKLIRLRSKLK